MTTKLIDMVGFEVNGITVVSFSHHKDQRRYYNCICACGKEVVFTGKSLRKAKREGTNMSCGCKWKSPTESHGLSKTPMYYKWRGMNERCYNAKKRSYKNYGARGIGVCERWRGPDIQGLFNFIQDMGDCPEGYSLERIDVDGDYGPDNCMWENASNQGFNKRLRSTNSTGITGVFFMKGIRKKPWKADLKCNGVALKLGNFETLFEAACARKSAELAYFPSKTLSR